MPSIINHTDVTNRATRVSSFSAKTTNTKAINAKAM